MEKKACLLIEFIHQYARMGFPEKRMRKIAASISADFRIPRRTSISVVLCSDAVIRRLNRTYRRKDRPTDVLSFPFNDADLLGEIYISLPRCAVQARRYGGTFDQEVARIFVHGMVHLLGYDHHLARERTAMEKVEARYARRSGSRC